MSSNAETIKSEQNPAQHERKHYLRIIAIVVGSLILVLLVGGYLYLDSKYSKADALLDEKQYDQALVILAEIPSFFLDVTELKTYTEGCAALDRGDFENARAIFDGLDEFRNSSKMLLETGYQEAATLLEAKEYEKAAKAFASLGKYKDAETKVMEAKYQAASVLFQNKEYEKAAAAFIALGDYQDAAAQSIESYYQLGLDLLNRKEYVQASVILQKLKEIRYKDSPSLLVEAKHQIAVDYYHKKEYRLARDLFSYSHKDGEKYIALLKAHDPFYPGGDLDLLWLYEDLLEMGDFEDAKSLRADGKFYLVRFNGRWETAGGSDFFEIDINTLLTRIDSSLPIPIRHYGFGYTTYWFRAPNKDGKVYVETDVGELKLAYELTFFSENMIKVYCYDNQKTYTMTKK